MRANASSRANVQTRSSTHIIFWESTGIIGTRKNTGNLNTQQTRSKGRAHAVRHMFGKDLGSRMPHECIDDPVFAIRLRITVGNRQRK